MVAEQQGGNGPGMGESGTAQPRRGILDLGKSQLTAHIHEATEALRKTRECLGEGDSVVSRLANTAVNGAARVEEYVNSAEPRTVMRDVNRFARRQPEMFMGGALLAGLILGRFLRSRPEDEYEGSLDDSRADGQEYGAGSRHEAPQSSTGGGAW